jgi:hypothetical protein
MGIGAHAALGIGNADLGEKLDDALVAFGA